MSTIANTELVVLQEEQVRLWDDLELERVSRIAGDDANNALSLQLQDNLFGTEGRLSTEVLHREQGDLNNLGTLNALTQALSDYRIKTDQEINAEQIARQQLGVDLNASISSATASFNHREYKIYEAINGFKAEYYDDHTQLDDRISKYEDMLQDITTDSIQITMDNGEINMGAWTILSQAREWDLEILGKVKGFQDKTVEDVDTALEELQKMLPVEQDLISKVIEALSDAPIITKLSDMLNSSISNQDDLGQRLAQEAVARAEEIIKLASQQAAELASEKQALADQINLEAQERIDALTREGEVRYNQIVDLEDGFTSRFELIETEQSTSLTAFNNYKASTDNSLANFNTSINLISGDLASQGSVVNALDLRLKDTEETAASAVTKSEAALTETSAQAEIINGITASLADKADASALNILGTEIEELDGKVSLNTSSLTQLQGNLDNVNTELSTKASLTALNSLSGTVETIGNQTVVNTNAVTNLKNRVDVVEGAVAVKLDASVISDYYTKGQADDKSAEIAAGKIESYDANLVIGGTNLLTSSMNLSNTEDTYKGGKIYRQTRTASQNIHDTHDSVISVSDLDAGDYTLSFDIKSSIDVPDMSSNLSYFYDPNTTTKTVTSQGYTGTSPDGKAEKRVTTSWQRIWITWTQSSATATKKLIINRIYGNGLDYSVDIANIKFEKGNKATDWTPNSSEVQEQLKTNATAIQTINAEVSRVDGRVTTESDRITTLTGRVDTVQNGLATKADVTALSNIYTKAETDDKVTQITAGEIQAFKSSLSIGGENLFLGTAEKSKPIKHKGYGVTEYVIQPWQMSVDAGYTTSHITFDGEYYVLSFDAKASVDGSSIRSYFYDPSNTISAETSQGYTSNTLDGGVYFTLSTKWERYWVRWKQPLGVTSKQIIYARFDGQHGQAVTYQFARVKLETGTLATDYSLSGTEVDQALDANANAISETKTQVGNIEGTVSTHTSSLEHLSSNLSNVSNTASQALVSASDALSLAQTTSNALSTETSRVDTLTSRYAKLPKRNLVLGTNEVKQGVFWHNFGRLAERIQGEITISFDCEKVNPNEADAGAGVGFNYGNGHDGGGYQYVYHPVFGSGHFSHTLTVDSQSFTHFAIYSNNIVRIHNVMVTYGNTDEKWSIAPEELASKSDISVIYQTKADATSSSAAITSEVRSSLNASLYDNLIVNSDFSSGKLGWVSAPGYIDTMFDAVLNDNSGHGVNFNVREGDSNTYYMHTSGTSQGYTEAYQEVSAKGSTQYQLSAYTAAHRTTSIIFAYFFNSSNQLIGNTAMHEPNQQNNQETWGGTSIENYKQCYINFTTPPGCTTIRVVLRKTTGQDTYVFATRFQLTEFIIPPNGPIPWSNGRAGGNTVVREQTRSVNGLMGSKVVTVDNNGVMSGYGLLSEVIEGRVTSSFGVNADTFFIGAPASNKKPFIVTTYPQDINGVSYPAGTWIDVALIANATIGTAKIADLAVTGAKIANATIGNAKITDIDAGKINAGFISAARIEARSLSADKLSTAAIETISLAAQNVTIYKDPNNPYGERMVQSGGLIQIYDANNRLRVKLGIW